MPIDRFTGLRNQQRPERLAPGSLVDCNNVILDDTGALESRFGSSLFSSLGGITDGYCMPHERHGYALAAGSLYFFDRQTLRTVATGLTDTQLHWAAFGDNLFYAGEVDEGWIVDGAYRRPLRIPLPPVPEMAIMAGHLNAGQYQVTQVFHHFGANIDTPAPASLSLDVPQNSALWITVAPPTGYVSLVYVTQANSTVERYLGSSPGGALAYDGQTLGESLDDALINTYPLPDAPVVGLAVYGQCLHVAFYNASNNETTMVYSQRAHYQAYRLGKEAYSVQGQVVQMLGIEQGIVIATDQAVWLWTEDGSDAGKLDILTRYGCNKSDKNPMERDAHGRVAIHTVHGLVTFPPLDESAQRKFIPPDGVAIAMTIIDQNGMMLAVANQAEEGEAYNQYE